MDKIEVKDGRPRKPRAPRKNYKTIIDDLRRETAVSIKLLGTIAERENEPDPRFLAGHIAALDAVLARLGGRP